MNKICYRCKIEKTLEHFNKDKYSKDGHTYRCKICTKEYDKKRNEEYLKRPEVINRINLYRQKPENKKRTKEYNHQLEKRKNTPMI